MVYEVFGVFLGKIIIQAIDFNGGGYRNRTGVHGFSIECIFISYKLYLINFNVFKVRIKMCKSMRVSLAQIPCSTRSLSL
jgi:hypothetical protein